MLEGEGRVFKVGRYTVAVRLPKTLVADSCFPFKVGDKVHVKIVNGEIIITNKSSG
jgi:antitoxin component of MazEF toxin-antitoxin module